MHRENGFLSARFACPKSSLITRCISTAVHGKAKNDTKIVAKRTEYEQQPSLLAFGCSSYSYSYSAQRYSYSLAVRWLSQCHASIHRNVGPPPALSRWSHDWQLPQRSPQNIVRWGKAPTRRKVNSGGGGLVAVSCCPHWDEPSGRRSRAPVGRPSSCQLLPPLG